MQGLKGGYGSVALTAAGSFVVERCYNWAVSVGKCGEQPDLGDEVGEVGKARIGFKRSDTRHLTSEVEKDFFHPLAK